MSGVTFVNGAVFTMGNASGDTKWSTNLQIDSLNAYSVVLEQTSGPGTGGQLSYDGAHLLLNGVPVEGGGGGGTSESNSFGSWTYRVDSAAGSCGFFSGSIRLGKTPSNPEGVLFLSSLNAAITNNSSAQVVISQGDVYARITLTFLSPATYYYSYTCTVPPISFTVGQPVSLYFYSPSPFLQGPAVVIPAASGSSSLRLVGSADSLITLGGHGTTFTVGVEDGTDTLKVGPIDINKNSFGTPFIYQNVATSGTLVLGSSRAATDIIEISDTAGNASVSVALLNGNINMNSSSTSSVELTGEINNNGSFIVQADNYQNISLTESSTVNSLVAGTAGLTANSLVFTVEPTSTSIVQSIASDGSLFLGSSQAASDIIELSDTAGVASVSVSLNNGTINMGSLPNTVELAGNPPPTGSFLIQNGSNENISLTASSKVNSLVAGTAGLNSNSLVFTVGATTTSIVQDISSGGIVSIGSSTLPDSENTLQITDDGTNGFVAVGGRPGGGQLFLVGQGVSGAQIGLICVTPAQPTNKLQIGATNTTPQYKALEISAQNVLANLPLEVNTGGVTLSMVTGTAYSQITSSGANGLTGGELLLGTAASGGNIVITDNLVTVNKQLNIDSAGTNTNPVTINQYNSAISVITQGLASSGTMGIGSSQARQSTLQISDIPQNGATNYVEIQGVGPTPTIASLFLSGAQGTDQLCSIYPNLASGSQLLLGSSQAQKHTLTIQEDNTRGQISVGGGAGAPIVLTGGGVNDTGVIYVQNGGPSTTLYLGANGAQYQNIALTQPLTTMNTPVNFMQPITGPLGIVTIASSNGEANLQLGAAEGDAEWCGIQPVIASGGVLNLGSSNLHPTAIEITDPLITFNTPATLNSYSQTVLVSAPNGIPAPISNPAIVVPGVAAVYAVLLDFGGFGSTIAYWNGTIWQAGGSVLAAYGNTGIINTGTANLVFLNNSGGTLSASVIFIKLGGLTTLP